MLIFAGSAIGLDGRMDKPVKRQHCFMTSTGLRFHYGYPTLRVDPTEAVCDRGKPARLESSNPVTLLSH